MVEIAVKLVKTVHRRQKLIAVAQVVFAKLAGAVTERLKDFGQGGVLFLEPQRRAGNADGSHAGANRVLTSNERRTPGGTARVRVVIGEQHALLGDAIDVRRVAHHAVRVGADVPHADVVAKNNKDIGFLTCGVQRSRQK